VREDRSNDPTRRRPVTQGGEERSCSLGSKDLRHSSAPLPQNHKALYGQFGEVLSPGGEARRSDNLLAFLCPESSLVSALVTIGVRDVSRVREHLGITGLVTSDL
jgi:hypothetical protein